MEKSLQIESKPKENWFVNKIKKYQIITFTFGFLLIYQLVKIMFAYFADKNLFLERFGLNIWFSVFGLIVVYFFQWLLVVWIALKFPKIKLKQEFSKHPITTIVLFILYVADLPYRLAEYSGGGIVIIFETIVYYAFLSFLWWLLVCWISSKIFRKQRFRWRWYQKVIEFLFGLMPIAYKIIFSLIVSFILFYVLFILLTVVFKYSGQDLKILFS